MHNQTYKVHKHAQVYARKYKKEMFKEEDKHLTQYITGMGSICFSIRDSFPLPFPTTKSCFLLTLVFLPSYIQAIKGVYKILV